MLVLLVEDDDSIAVPMAAGLRRQGFDVERVATGRAALAASGYELVLLDLGLPDANGFDLLRKLRAVADVPIIIVSARDDEVDRVAGLEAGADDYVVKPFSLRELAARMRAVSRRSSPAAGPDRQSVGPLVVDHREHRVFVEDEEVSLTPKEFDLLSLLAADPGALVSRKEILREVWDTNWYGTTRTVDVHVASLRKKLGHAGWIETSRGVGFRLVIPT
ncbi:MAG TPA: response regulator transcription factor [Acidimicrobiales bacterium]|nr:response regulator transcription factor [Acidimicrobiales bacterium]